MKVFSKMKILSLFILFFFMFNVTSLILTNIRYGDVVGLNITENFFAVKTFSDNIVAKMLSNKMQNSKQHKTENKKEQDKSEVYEFLLPSIVLPSVSNFGLSFNMNAFVGVCVQKYLNTEVEYPLKIPFWFSIFLLLLTKILFNVLPRSISVSYNIQNIERACIVYKSNTSFFYWR